MKLLDAIIEVLQSAEEPALSYGQISDRINEFELYRRNDGMPVTQNQVRMSISRDFIYFDKAGEQVRLIEKAIAQYRKAYFVLIQYIQNSYKRSSNTTKEIAITSIFLVWYSHKNFSISTVILDTQSSIVSIIDKMDFLDLENRNYVLSCFQNLEKDNMDFIFHTIRNLYFNEIPTDSDFASFFNDIINEYSNSNSDYRGEYSSPRVLNDFIGSIFEVSPDSVIFDPFAGSGGTLISTLKSNKVKPLKFVANDIYPSAKFLGSLNLFVYGAKEFNYHSIDFLTESYFRFEADLIVSVPPFGLKTHKYEKYGKGLPRYSEFLNTLPWQDFDSQIQIIASIIDSLTFGGNAAVVVPNSILFSGRKDSVYFRDLLVESGMLAGVIELPVSMFRPYLTVASSVLLIKKKQQYSKNEVFFFDGTKLSVDQFEKNGKSIISAFHNKRKIENGVFVNGLDVLADGKDLTPKQYLLELDDNVNYRKLEDVAESIFPGMVISKGNLGVDGYPYIQVRDLKDDGILSEVDISGVETFVSIDQRELRNGRFVPNNSVLISRVGSNLKPNLFRSNIEVLCNPNILVIKTDESKILPEYLITQLQSEYVLKQIAAISRSVTVSHFNLADFKKIKIISLSIDEQRKFITSYFGKKLELVKNISDREREDDLYNVIASLKHELKQPISSLGMDMKRLREFLEEKIAAKETLDWDESIIELLPGQTLEENEEFRLKNVFSRISVSVESSQKTLNKTEELLNVGAGSFKPEKVKIKEFLVKKILPMFANSNCTINVLGEEKEMMVDSYQIEILFKRLIENALKHGFNRNSQKTENIINIRISDGAEYKTYNEIIVENNGIPFDAEFDVKKFHKGGITSNRYVGTGFGGFHIKRIIESHKGEFHFADKSEIGESQFKVKFKIYLP